MSPRRPRRPCPGAGRYKGRCPALIDHGVRVCPRCAPLAQEQQRQAGREYDRGRGSSSQRGYGSNWQKLRRMVLNAEPLCRHCKEQENRLTPATDVDHIDGDTGNLEWENLQPLCRKHHNIKSRLEQGSGWKGGKGGSLSTDPLPDR